MELLRSLCTVYLPKWVFEHASEQRVECEGVVLIDEIDAHLHPAWQTRIGEWLTNAFPNLQFIVTTHSPFICRSCGDKGIIWQLLPNEGGKPVTGELRDRLVYGNILDAFGTDLFGKDIERSKIGQQKLERYSYLSQKLIFDKSVTQLEKDEFKSLQKTFLTDAPNTL